MNQPYTFTGAYAGCYGNRIMAIDERHVYLIHAILTAWPFKSALELGAYLGASSTAFVEAVNRGSVGKAAFCDVRPTDSLRKVAGRCKDQTKVAIYPYPTTFVLDLPEAFDFVLVDANHDMDSVRPEVDRLLVRKPLCIMAHDTNATAAGYGRADGAQYLRQVFEAHPEYICLHDCEQREGEETHRGLFFATTSNELFELAEAAYAKWCGAPMEVSV
jgi:hypothetical protein